MILKIGFSFLKLDQTSFVGVDKQVYFWTRQMFLFGFIYLYVVLMRPINLWVNGDTHEQKMLNWMIVSCVIFWQKDKTYSKYFHNLFIFSNDTLLILPSVSCKMTNAQLFISMICNCKKCNINLSSPCPKIVQRKYTFLFTHHYLLHPDWHYWQKTLTVFIFSIIVLRLF